MLICTQLFPVQQQCFNLLENLRPAAGCWLPGRLLAARSIFDLTRWLDAPVKRVCGVDVPMPYAANLEALALPQAETIVAGAKEVCYRD